jgi:WD40 repeat protein
MSEAATVSLDRVLKDRGRITQLDAHVSSCAFSGQVAAWALGDGTVRLLNSGGGDWSSVQAHDGAVLALADDAAGGFLTGGDDGRLMRIGRDGALAIVATYGSKWVEHVARFADGRARLLACAVGKQLHLLDGEGASLKVLVHPSTVTGIAFDPKGKRVAASHYNGVSLWYVASKTDSPRRLEWKGSHIGIAFSPDNDHVVTAMQENALHGWRLSDGQHMRMPGYPSKTESLSFTRAGKWLASSGAESVVLWPFFGGGPMGKAPSELAMAMEGALCSRVVCHPQKDVVAAGYSDGLMLVADLTTQRVLPVCGPGRGAVTAVGWSGDGGYLAFGTETGFLALIDFTNA